MARKRKRGGDNTTAPKSIDEYNKSLGYSDKALKALKAGKYDELTGRDPQFHTSQDQLKAVQRIPALKGMTASKNSTVERKKTEPERKQRVDTARARRKYAERQSQPSMEFTKNLKQNPAQPIISKGQSDLMKGFEGGKKASPIISSDQKKLSASVKDTKENAQKPSGVASTRRSKQEVERENEKPSTKYNNTYKGESPNINPSRDKKYDKDFDEFYNWRYDKQDIRDYDPATDTETEHWRKVKKDLMKKNNWTEKEFDQKFDEYYNERSQKESDAEVNDWAKFAEKHPALASAGQLALNPGSWLEGGVTMAEGALSPFLSEETKDKYFRSDANDYRFTHARTREAVKEAVKDKIKSGAGKTAYEMGMGFLDLPSGAAGMAANNAVATQRRKLENGTDRDKAAQTGAASGLVSYITNKLGMEKALGAEAATPLGSIGKATVTEGSENLVEDRLNTIADLAINRDKADIIQLYKYYTGQGMSPVKALAMVAKDTGVQDLTSFGTGALMGGALNILNGAPTRRLPSLLSDSSEKLHGDMGILPKGETAEVEKARNLGQNTDFQTPQNSEKLQPSMEKLGEILREREALETSRSDMEKLRDALSEQRTSRLPSPEDLQTPMENLEEIDGLLNDIEPNVNTRGYSDNELAELTEYAQRKSEIRKAMNEDFNLFDPQSIQRIEDLDAQGKALDAEIYEKYPELFQNGKFMGVPENVETPQSKSSPVDTLKQRQLEVINKTNPAPDDMHAWIRDVDDIKTFEEVWDEDPNIDPDFDDEMAQEAMRTGKIKVYSSYDIEDGTFVTPSFEEALSYAGNPKNVKSAIVNLDDVAWIDSTQGQLARVNGKADAPKTEPVPERVPEPIEEEITRNDVETEIPEEITEPDVIPEPTGESMPKEVPHTKTSEAYTNTGRRGGGWNEEEYNQYTDPSQFQYEDHTEEESVRGAIQMRSQEGREGFKERVMNQNDRLTTSEIDGLMLEWRDLTGEARQLESEGADASEKWNEAVRVFRKIQTETSDNAKALQAMAKWSRNTPEGLLARAENILNGKSKVEQSELQDMLDKYTRKHHFKFSDEFVKDFLKEADGIFGLDPNSREARRKMAKLGKMVNSQLPSSFTEKLTSLLMDNMLGNFRTLITRNAGGNVGLNAVEQVAQKPLAAAIDALVSKKTGKRTQAGLSGAGMSEYLKGFASGLKDELDDFKTGLHTSRTGENSFERAINANRHVFKDGGIMDRWDSLIKNGLSLGDRPFYEAVYNQTLGDYQRLHERGLMGEVIQNLPDEEFAKYSETAAKMNALAAVYQNDTKLSDAMLEFKNAIGDLSKGMIGVDVLSQFSMPFVKTPANVVNVGIDYSPLGMLRNLIRTSKELKNGNFDQNRFANESSRNILGTLGMAGAAALRGKGVISGGYSDDTDEKQAQKEAGEQEHALNLPNGYQMDISWLPVVGSNAVSAAAAYDAYKNSDGNPLNAIGAAANAGGKSMFNLAAYQGMQRLMGGGNSYDSDQGIGGNMLNTVKEGLGQFAPALVRQIGQVTDEYQRDVSTSNKGLLGLDDTYNINSFANNLPIIRELALAPKVETTGELSKQNQGRNAGWKILENMILPGKITQVKYSELNEEAKRLKELTTSPDAYMPKINRTNFDTDERILSNDEWVEAEQKYYSDMTSVGTMIMGSEAYKNADPDSQVNALKTAYDGVKKGVQSEYNGKSVTGAAKAYVEAGGGDKGVEAVFKYCNDKIAADQLGMTVSNYRKKEEKNPGSAAQWAENKKSAEAIGFTKEDGSVDTAGYEKAIAKAGSQSQKFANDLPKLKELGVEKPAYYVYANAVNKHPEIDPREFADTYNEMNTDKKDKLTQSEMLAYFNEYQFADDPNEDARIIQDLWATYNDGTWKKVPYLKKDGTWGAK